MPKCIFFIILITICSFGGFANTAKTNRQNIVFILCDDLGRNDFSYHGSNQFTTPNIDAMAYTGVMLENYYTGPICTPSRAAFLTGKEPYTIGMQHNVLQASEARGLPLNLTLLPQYLKALDYKTHIVGKWHLGHYTKEYTPTYRGFDTHLGPWTGHHDEFDHWAFESSSDTLDTDFQFSITNSLRGLDFRRNLELAKDLHGQYSTRLFTNESVSIIKNHNQSHPLFLFLAHTAGHTGNPYNPFAVPAPTIANFSYIQNWKRQRLAAMVQELDNSVGEVFQALKTAGMLDNTIVVFASDNGAPLEGAPDENFGSNWPLKGNKYTIYEGGTRVPALVWSKQIKNPGRISNKLMHVTDWLPTIFCAAGGNINQLKQHDGYNQWSMITQDSPTERDQIIYNIDGDAAAIRAGKWKIVKGLIFAGLLDAYSGASTNSNLLPFYNTNAVLNSQVYNAVSPLTKTSLAKLLLLRNSARVRCSNELESNQQRTSTCSTVNGHICLFDLETDPCETNDLSSQHPEMVKQLLAALVKANETYVVPSNKPIDPRGNPALWDYAWINFGDYITDLK